MNILMIEPDKILSDIYERAFKQESHTVVIVSSAQAAVHAADIQIPDVVILEVQLPTHNGIEFLYEFRSYSEWLGIPIIIHSYVPPHDLAGIVTLRDELGVVGQLYKPTTTLRQLMASVLPYAPIVAV